MDQISAPSIIGSLWKAGKELFTRNHAELRSLRAENQQLRADNEALFNKLRDANSQAARRASGHVFRNVMWTEKKYQSGGDHGPFCSACWDKAAVPLANYSYGDDQQCPKCQYIFGDVFPERRRSRMSERDDFDAITGW